MPIEVILTRKFTRVQIVWRIDELAIKSQRTQDKKIMARISALSRLLAKLDGRVPDPKSRQ